MTRDETKRAAEAVLSSVWASYVTRNLARAYLAQCEREEKIERYLRAHRTQLKIDVAELDAAIKAIEEGRG